MAFCLAQIFGMVSPKMMMTMVSTSVPTHIKRSLPVSRITSTDTRDDAPMFTRLLPIRMALRALSKCSRIFTAAPARFEPSSRRFSMRS